MTVRCADSPSDLSEAVSSWFWNVWLEEASFALLPLTQKWGVLLWAGETAPKLPAPPIRPLVHGMGWQCFPLSPWSDEPNTLLYISTCSVDCPVRLLLPGYGVCVVPPPSPQAFQPLRAGMRAAWAISLCCGISSWQNHADAVCGCWRLWGGTSLPAGVNTSQH